MRRRIICLAGLLFLCSGMPAFSQGGDEQLFEMYMGDGSLLLLTNRGGFGKPQSTANVLAGPGPHGSYYSSDARLVSQAGTVFLAKVRGELRVSGSQEGGVFRPGPILPDGTPAADSDRWRIYPLHFWDRVGSQNYENWPADLGAPVNADGTPRIHGMYQLWYVMNDMDSSALREATGSEPMGLEVQALVYEAPMPGTLYFHYTFINKGADTLHDAYAAHFVDVDLRDGWTDLTGADSLRSLAYAWQHPFAPSSEGAPAAFGACFVQTPRVASLPGDSARWGDGYVSGYRNIPVSSITMPLKSSYNIDALLEPGRQVQRSLERWHALAAGRALDGPVYAPGSNTPRRFWYDGDPLTGSGWLAEQGIRTAGGVAYTTGLGHDARMMLAAGPFTMLPGDTQQVCIAWVYTRAATPMSSVHLLRSLAEAARASHDDERALSYSTASIAGYDNEAATVRAILGAEATDLQVSAAAYRNGVRISEEFPLAGKQSSSWTRWQYEGELRLPRDAEGADILFTVRRGSQRFLAPGAPSMPLSGDLSIEGVQVLEDEDFNYVLSPDEAATVFPRLRFEGAHTLRDLLMLPRYEFSYSRVLAIDSIEADSWYPGEYTVGGDGWQPQAGYLRIPFSGTSSYDLYSPSQNMLWEDAIRWQIDSAAQLDSWDLLMEHVAGPSTQQLGVRIVDPDALQNRWYVASLRIDSIPGNVFKAGVHYYAVDLQDSVTAAMLMRGYAVPGFTTAAPVTDGFHVTRGNAFTSHPDLYYASWGYVTDSHYQSMYRGRISTSSILTEGRDVSSYDEYPSLLLRIGRGMGQRAYHFVDSTFAGMVDIPLTVEAVSPDGSRRQLDVALLERESYVLGRWDQINRNTLLVFRSDYGVEPKARNAALVIPEWGYLPELPEDDRSYASFFIYTDSTMLAEKDTVLTLPFYHEVSTADRYRFNPFITVMSNTEVIPAQFTVGEPYPQPATDWLRVRTDLPEAAALRADVYDMLGRRVRTLYDGSLPAGSHLLPWDGRDAFGQPAPTGSYLLRISSSNKQVMRRMLLLR